MVLPGDFWGLGTEDFHKVKTEGLKIYTLKLSPNEIGQDIANILRFVDFPFIGHLEDKAFKRVLDSFNNIFETSAEKTQYTSFKSTSAALMILSEFLENSCSLSSVSNSLIALEYVKKAITFLKEHFKENITLSETASVIGISECYLSDIFSKYAGCRFIEYLNNLRLQNVQKLLLSSSDSITNIAFSSGFGSVSSMNRCFIKAFGISPREYRAKNR